MESLYRNTELRKLPPRFRTKLSQLLDVNDDWKKLMSSIPSELNPAAFKYKLEHIQLVERHGFSTRKSCSEVLLDEWSTSGRNRPKVETLFDLLQKCQLYRAADYVADEILSVPSPPRPLEGPARRISDIFVIDEDVSEIEMPSQNPNPNPIPKPIVIPNLIQSSSSNSVQNQNPPPPVPARRNQNQLQNQKQNKIETTVPERTNVAVQNQTQNQFQNQNLNSNTTSSLNTVIDHSKLDKLLEQLNNYDYQKGNLINFTIDILSSATNDFHKSYKIGSGAFGTVYKFDVGSQRGPPLAIKLLHPTSTLIEEQFLTEINVLSKYRHENLVSLIGYCTNGPQYCLIYEFMSGGTLMEAIACEVPQNALSWQKRLSIVHGVAKGIHYLHTAFDKPLIHRDIKSANILLSDLQHSKIGDFGLAKSFSSTSANQSSALTSTIFGTSAYMAPEAFRGDISPKMDIFSFGVILLEIITGLPPYDEERDGGNDIVTYLEDAVEDDDIIPWIDCKPDAGQGTGTGTTECLSSLYEMALKCLAEKKKRLTSDVLLKEFQTLMLSFTHCGKTF